MTAQALFDEVAAEYLSRPDVSVGRMLRRDGLKVNGKVFPALLDDRLVVKVPAQQASALVAAGRPTPSSPVATPCGSGCRSPRIKTPGDGSWLTPPPTWSPSPVADGRDVSRVLRAALRP